MSFHIVLHGRVNFILKIYSKDVRLPVQLQRAMAAEVNIFIILTQLMCYNWIYIFVRALG
jgi:hypothetical protein